MKELVYINNAPYEGASFKSISIMTFPKADILPVDDEEPDGLHWTFHELFHTPDKIKIPKSRIFDSFDALFERRKNDFYKYHDYKPSEDDVTYYNFVLENVPHKEAEKWRIDYDK